LLIQESTIFTNPTSIRSGIIFDNRKFRSRYKEFLALCALMAGLFLFRRRQDYFHQYNEISEIIHCILFKRKSSLHFSGNVIFCINPASTSNIQKRPVWHDNPSGVVIRPDTSKQKERWSE